MQEGLAVFGRRCQGIEKSTTTLLRQILGQEASAQFQPFRCLGEQLVGTGQSAFAAALLQRSKRLHHGRDAANGAGGGQLAAESESRDGSPCFLIIAL